MAINSEFSHEKWWFSIAMLNYQRVPQFGGKHFDSFSRIPRSVCIKLYKLSKYYTTVSCLNMSQQYPMLQPRAKPSKTF